MTKDQQLIRDLRNQLARYLWTPGPKDDDPAAPDEMNRKTRALVARADLECPEENHVRAS